jgi:NAD(P)-dependent dehydrogenase (short-subunit alcohol dehydrogenase family)
MTLSGMVAVVTGGASGIGRAVCRRFAAEGAKVAVADLSLEAAQAVAAEIGGLAVAADVSRAADVEALVARVTESLGPIDLVFSNAGLFAAGDEGAGDEVWSRAWDVHVMAHVHAARAVLGGLLARGRGTIIATASAAGLLTNLGAAPYAVTKHAAVAFAEWLAVTYGDRGIRVACLCPMGVRTQMVEPVRAAGDALASVLASGPVLEPEAVADEVVRALAGDRFLILPHPEVGEMWRRKADDVDRWIRGMRRFKAKLAEDGAR